MSNVESSNAEVASLPLAETILEETHEVETGDRDRIVILGRRAAGKTVYLSVLYEKYWKAIHGLTMKAISGNVHTDLVKTVDALRHGRWPPATLETQHCDLEIDYKGQRYVLVALDYAGELFRKAFVEDVRDTEETAVLVEHIDRAAAVIMLVDPATLGGDDVDAKIDDDFGMTQVATRILNWPGGDKIPFVLALTKADVNGKLISNEGGVERFVAKHYPALARTIGKVMIFKVAAVEVETTNSDNIQLPKANFKSYQIEKPLVFCLEQIEYQRQIGIAKSLQRRRAKITHQRIKTQERAQRKFRLKFVGCVALMIFVAAAIIGYTWMHRP